MAITLFILSGVLALASTSFVPEEKCGANEEMGWIGGCDGPGTCPSESDPLISCSPMPSMPACVCKEGFYRGYLGDCISAQQCEQCSKPNEFYGCSSACDNECKNIKTQSRLRCPIKNIVCNKQCYCKDGYARDNLGNCIPVDQCDSCGSNEELSLGRSCPPDHCVSLVARFKCDSTEENKLRCRCKPGFLRVTEGSPCVPICSCPEMRRSETCHQIRLGEKAKL